MANDFKTIVTVDDYYEINGISLVSELKGSFDNDENAPRIFIRKCENVIFDALSGGAYDFDMIMLEEIKKDSEKLLILKESICDQIEYELRNDTFTSELSPRTYRKLRRLGLMNLRSY